MTPPNVRVYILSALHTLILHERQGPFVRSPGICEICRERLGFRADANCDYEVHWGTNDQYRICFVWSDAGPKDVEIVDYH